MGEGGVQGGRGVVRGDCVDETWGSSYSGSPPYLERSTALSGFVESDYFVLAYSMALIALNRYASNI
jgi:hypothetical protein